MHLHPGAVDLRLYPYPLQVLYFKVDLLDGMWLQWPNSLRLSVDPPTTQLRESTLSPTALSNVCGPQTKGAIFVARPSTRPSMRDA